LVLTKGSGYLCKKKGLDKDRLIQELFQKVEDLTLRVGQLEVYGKENKILRKENAALQSENASLRSRLNSDSSNSSKPPSSDGYKKKPAFNKRHKGIQGGQKGHKGNNLHQVANPDKIVKCVPEKCSCGHEFHQDEFSIAEKRQVFDLPQPKLEVTEYQIHKANCPVCGLGNKGAVPESIKAPAQYGNGVKSYVVMLNVHYKLPYKKIQLLFKDLFGYPINESTIFSASQNCYNNLEGTENKIKTKVSLNDVVHADETGLRIEGKLQWLHTATTTLFTYLFVHKNRGKEALESESSILDRLNGWLVHDSWSSYFSFKNYKHAMCGAHILRELQGLVDTGKSKWAKTFKMFLMSIYEMPIDERIKRKQLIQDRFMRICNIGQHMEPPPIKTKGKRGRYKRTKGRNLVERLIKYQDAVLAFAFYQQVPFTNNLAERDIRPTKIKQKISNSFRSFKGAEYYARIEGFISTARKNNKNIFNELCTTFDGCNFITESSC
jgi:transposase